MKSLIAVFALLCVVFEAEAEPVPRSRGHRQTQRKVGDPEVGDSGGDVDAHIFAPQVLPQYDYEANVYKRGEVRPPDWLREEMRRFPPRANVLHELKVYNYHASLLKKRRQLCGPGSYEAYECDRLLLALGRGAAPWRLLDQLQRMVLVAEDGGWVYTYADAITDEDLGGLLKTLEACVGEQDFLAGHVLPVLCLPQAARPSPALVK